jgi:intein/homing endonuclease
MDESVFEKIDSPEKAYWLGFISADGCIDLSVSAKLVISLKIDDVKHLEKFRTFLSANNPIKQFPNYKSPRAIIQVCRKKIVDDLARHGVGPRKSKTIEFPDIDPKFFPDFIRGYFDGDGCLTGSYLKGKKEKGFKYNLIFYSGSRVLLNDIQDRIVNALTVRRRELIHDVRKSRGSYVLAYGGNTQVENIQRYLLSNSDVRMERKYLPCLGGK